MKRRALLSRRLRSPSVAAIPTCKKAILCVDDEPDVLLGLQRSLGKTYEVITATGVPSALQLLAKPNDIRVVITDLQMAHGGGIELLGKLRESNPHLVRMLLTGVSDLETAVKAVNDGQVFRFLTKPCPPPRLLLAVKAGMRQFDLEQAERILMQQTLYQSVELLVEVLSLTCPEAFGRAVSLRAAVRELGQHVKLHNLWQIEIAALLSQLGSIEVDPALLTRAAVGAPLTEQEATQMKKLPQLSQQILQRIPRLEPIHAILRHQNRGMGKNVPVGAKVLCLLTDYDTLTRTGHLSSRDALSVLSKRAHRYELTLIEGLMRAHEVRATDPELREILVKDLTGGMLLERDLLTQDGRLLIARGHHVTDALIARLKRNGSNTVTEPLLVRVAS